MSLSEKEWKEVLIMRHGVDVQEQISRGTVAIAGIGGLGSNIAVALVRLGIEKLHILDFDVVEPSNLNRQVYLQKHLGMAKVDALEDFLKEINPHVEVKKTKVRISSENVKELFKDEDIICEAFDVKESKGMLVNELIENFPDKYIVSASGMGGYTSGNDITTRKFGKNLFVSGDGNSDIAKGDILMAPRVAICANHQANVVLRLLLGITEA
ncbi:MAG: sulfur carrier protein ThiS adenylyltransferase ThiF [Anaerovoracaceae bacterium]